MKKVFKVAILSILAFAMVACSKKDSTTVVFDAKEKFGCNVLNFYNWGEYIGEHVISNFEKAYNAKVNYSLFDSNEAMYTKLLGGNSYDIIIPSDYTIERMIKEDLLLKLDLTKIPNMSLIADEVKNLPYDPNNDYAIPYMWGSVGIVYNKEKIDPAKVEELGYNIFLDESLKDRAFLYDSERDSFMMAFKALGYSMNTENEEEIEAAYQWLLKVNDTINPAYVTDEVIDAMANGEKDIAVVYSGDAAYILSENEDMAYSMPKGGTNMWIDGMVIPKNAQCPDLAHEFLNYMLSYEAAKDNSLTVGYTSSNKQVVEELSGEGGQYFGNEAYLPRSNYELDEVFQYKELLKEKLAALWIKVKNK